MVNFFLFQELLTNTICGLKERLLKRGTKVYFSFVLYTVSFLEFLGSY